MKMTVLPRPLAGLSEIADPFPVVLCDVWGVVHDGQAPLETGVEALIAYRNTGGVVMLISNAPRPGWAVRDEMAMMGVDLTCHDGLITSGDVARSVLEENLGARVFHLGPERDLPIYQDLEIELSELDSADVVSCTGLFREDTEQPGDYDPMLVEMVERGLTMICANPDIVVESGDRLVPCAGALAARYADIGGEAVIVGKPNRPIYEGAMEQIETLLGRAPNPDDVLAIGDGVRTDIIGANRFGLEALFIASGVHASEYGDDVDPVSVGTFLEQNGAAASYFMPRLVW